MKDSMSKGGGDARVGIQSVEVAARLIEAMSSAAGPLPLKELAEAAGMPASKAHRYMVSLCRTGIAEQDPATGKYDFGSKTLAIGLAALGRIDVIDIATRTMRDLSDRTGATAVLAVWGEHGPTVVRFEENAHPVRMNVRVGSTLSVGRSAIGQTFGAYLPSNVTRPLLSAERELTGAAPGDSRLEDVFGDVRSGAFNRNVGAYVPGVAAMAAPIFDAQNRLVAVLGLLGHEVSLDTSRTGEPARELVATARAVSARLGYREETGAPES